MFALLSYLRTKNRRLEQIERLNKKFSCKIHQDSILEIEDESAINFKNNVIIGANTLVIVQNENSTKKLSSFIVGENTYIGEFNNIRAAGGKIEIGANCLISQHVSLIGINHGIRKDQLIINSEWDYTKHSIIIEDDVWIGSHSVILPGVKLSKGVIVAAGSVVNKSIPEFAIVGGVPAQIIKYRE